MQLTMASFQSSVNSSFACLRNVERGKGFSFCSYYNEDNGPFYEAYDMNEDPHQINNIAQDLDKKVFSGFKQRLDGLRRCQGHSCLKLRKMPIKY